MPAGLNCCSKSALGWVSAIWLDSVVIFVQPDFEHVTGAQVLSVCDGDTSSICSSYPAL